MLILLCGKMAAGKSTKAAELVASRSAVLFAEDAWLSELNNQIVRQPIRKICSGR